MQDRAESLEVQLAEKEQLVAALTERLEQAAEQLDRLHRTGADRSLRAGIVGFPPELIQQQQKLVEDLQRAVQQWEDMQPGAFFGRLETQLAQLQEMVGRIEPSGGGHSSEAHGGSDYTHFQAGHSASESPQTILDFMKASVAGEAPAAEQSGEQPGALLPVQTAAHIPLPPLEDPPEPVDVAQSSAEELGRACEARDNYIGYLLHRLRQIESLGHVPNSWAGLENVPAELRERLETLEKRLEETLRLAEVELSLQRAKLAREEVRIRAMDEQMQKELKRVRESSENRDADQVDHPGSGGRWKRMLGRRGGDAS